MINALTGEQYELSAGEHRATVVEVGAGLRAYTVGGDDVTASYPPDALPPKASGITLVPWPNRIRGGRYSFDGVDHRLPLTEPAAGNAIHGLGRWERWRPVDRGAAWITLALDLVPQTGYPFPLRVEVTYALDPAAGLSVTTQATNVGSARAPFGAGAHPYLSTRGHALADTSVRLPAGEVLVADDKGVPVGVRSVAGSEFDLRSGKRLKSLRLDHGFTALEPAGGRGAGEIRTPSGGARVWFDDTYRFVQVFTVDALTPQRAAVAMEPMTCAPDAFNTGAGLIVLEPGGGWRGSWGIEPLPA